MSIGRLGRNARGFQPQQLRECRGVRDWLLLAFGLFVLAATRAYAAVPDIGECANLNWSVVLPKCSVQATCNPAHGFQPGWCCKSGSCYQDPKWYEGQIYSHDEMKQCDEPSGADCWKSYDTERIVSGSCCDDEIIS